MKKKLKTLAKKSISTLRTLFSVKNEHFYFIFGSDDVFTLELKIDLRKTFVTASLSQNLENSSGYSLAFHNFHIKPVITFHALDEKSFPQNFKQHNYF